MRTPGRWWKVTELTWLGGGARGRGRGRGRANPNPNPNPNPSPSPNPNPNLHRQLGAETDLRLALVEPSEG